MADTTVLTVPRWAGFGALFDAADSSWAGESGPFKQTYGG